MLCPRFHTHARATGLLIATAALFFAAAPLAAQIRKVPVTSTTPRALPPGGIPTRAGRMALRPGTLPAFRQSLEVSLDSVHWSRSITTSISCAPGTNAACAANTRPIIVYLRWTPLDPPTDMTAAQQQKHALTQPYVIRTPGSNLRLCTYGNTSVTPSPGFPVSIVPSATGGAFPITCHWSVYGVSSTTQPPNYWLYPSNSATVVVNKAP